MTVWNEKILDFEVDILTMIVYIVVETDFYTEKFLYLTEKNGLLVFSCVVENINNVNDA
jgi:hypothetical protein